MLEVKVFVHCCVVSCFDCLLSAVLWSELYAESLVTRFYMLQMIYAFYRKVSFARKPFFEIVMEWGVANCILFYGRQLYFHGASKVTPHTLRTCQWS